MGDQALNRNCSVVDTELHIDTLLVDWLQGMLHKPLNA